MFNRDGFITLAADKNGVTDFLTRDEVIMHSVDTMIMN